MYEPSPCDGPQMLGRDCAAAWEGKPANVKRSMLGGNVNSVDVEVGGGDEGSIGESKPPSLTASRLPLLLL